MIKPALTECHVAVRPGRSRGILASLIALAGLSVAGAANAQTLTVDASASPSGNPHFWSACVGTGTASLTLRADLQTHYKLANRELGMLRVRGHGVLNDDMGIFHGTGSTPTYDWTKFDTYLAAIAAAGMRPIIELSFMPKDLAKSGDSRDPARDLAVYQKFIQAVVQHAVDKYGAADVGKWYWEVWNEPNYSGFWNGTMNDYFAMYDAAAAGAVAALPNIIIGGPATTQGSTTQMGDFLKHVKTSGARVTFLSSHAYPGGAGATAPANFGINDNNGRVGVITGNGYTTDQLESLNTEWNSAYTGQGGNTTDNNVSMDNHVNAPFILKSVKLLADQNKGDKPPLSIFSYWAVSDVFGEANGDAGSYIAQQGGGTLPFGSVFGLLTYQGVRKAAYNAFRMLNYTGSKMLAVTGGKGTADGVDGMATISADNSEVAIILYNYYSTINTTGMDSVTLNVNKLPFAGKNIFVTQFAIDADHSNPYSVWSTQGKPKNPTEAQWQAMRQAQHLALATPVTNVAGSATYTTTLTLPKQGAAMILLSLKRPVTGRNGLADIEAEDYDGQSGVTKEDSKDTSMGQSIAAAAAGSFVFYDKVDFSDGGVSKVDLRVNAQAATTIELHADTQTGPLIGKCDVAATASAWATQSCALTKTTGVHPVYAVFGGALRLNSLTFQPTDGGTGGTGGSGGAVGAGGTTSGVGGSGTSNGGAPSTGAGGAPSTAGSAPQSGGSTSANGGNSAVAGSNASNGTGGSVTGAPPPSSGDSGGCGCRVGSARAAWLDGAVVLPGLAALGLLIRRRRSRS
ncbi:MAG TPA: carbohydrate-binding protein [Polyangiaceae bacterium]|nr:carbohydrate-binding protein [Polyangiaceae bacterium]